MMMTEKELRFLVSASILMEHYKPKPYTPEEKLMLERHQTMVDIRKANKQLDEGIMEWLLDLEERDRITEAIMLEEGIFDGFNKWWKFY